MCFDGDAPDFYEQKNVRARKEHRCCECAEKVPARRRVSALKRQVGRRGAKLRDLPEVR